MKTSFQASLIWLREGKIEKKKYPQKHLATVSNRYSSWGWMKKKKHLLFKRKIYFLIRKKKDLASPTFLDLGWNMDLTSKLKDAVEAKGKQLHYPCLIPIYTEHFFQPGSRSRGSGNVAIKMPPSLEPRAGSQPNPLAIPVGGREKFLLKASVQMPFMQGERHGNTSNYLPSKAKCLSQYPRIDSWVCEMEKQRCSGLGNWTKAFPSCRIQGWWKGDTTECKTNCALEGGKYRFES